MDDARASPARQSCNDIGSRFLPSGRSTASPVEQTTGIPSLGSLWRDREPRPAYANGGERSPAKVARGSPPVGDPPSGRTRA